MPGLVFDGPLTAVGPIAGPIYLPVPSRPLAWPLDWCQPACQTCVSVWDSILEWIRFFHQPVSPSNTKTTGRRASTTRNVGMWESNDVGTFCLWMRHWLRWIDGTSDQAPFWKVALYCKMLCWLCNFTNAPQAWFWEIDTPLLVYGLDNMPLVDTSCIHIKQRLLEILKYDVCLLTFLHVYVYGCCMSSAAVTEFITLYL